MFALLGCEQDRSHKRLNAYFDLDSLLNSQIEELVISGTSVQKTVMKDGESETRSFEPDSVDWQREFAMIRPYNLNKPNFLGAYTTESTGNKVSYVPKNPQKQEIKEFVIIYDSQKHLQSVEIAYQSDKYIYKVQQHVKLDFQQNQIKHYQISGEQEMILLDPVVYQFSGTIIK